MTRAKILVFGTDQEKQLELLARGRFDIHRVETVHQALAFEASDEVAAILVELPNEARDGSLLQQLRLTFRRSHIIATVPENESWRLIDAINEFEIDRCLTTPLVAKDSLPALEAAAQSFELQRLDYRAYGTGISRLNRRVLCVDDEMDILQYYKSVLAPEANKSLAGVRRRRRRRNNDEGQSAPPPRPRNSLTPFTISLASSGEEAVELVAQSIETGMPFATGFFDMKMPGGIDGLETIRQIRALDPHINCAVATAYTDHPLEEIQAAFADYADWMYFNKPFTSGELLQACCNQVSRWNNSQGEKNLSRFVRKLRHLLGRHSNARTGNETINMLRMICERTLSEILQIDGWGMLLLDSQTQSFSPLVTKGVEGESGALFLEALTHQILAGEEGPIFTSETAPSAFAPYFASLAIDQLVSLPLEGESEPLGVLFAFVSGKRSPFSRQEVELTMRLAEEVSQALRILNRRHSYEDPQAPNGFDLNRQVLPMKARVLKAS